MHIRSIVAIARKDALDILLNKTTLRLLIMPIILAVLFVVMRNLFGGQTTNVLLYNPGKSGVEQLLNEAYPDIKITYANSPDDVTATFGPDGSHKSVSYALGVVVPADFDASLRSGGHPQLNLYINGNELSNAQRLLLLSTITNYSRSLVNQQPPATITIATINPSQPTNNTVFFNFSLFSTTASLLSSFLVGILFIPILLVEEKEKKTLRMLMISSASFADVVAGKLLVGLSYQLALAIVALSINQDFTGQLPFILLFALLGACFSITLGLLSASLFQTLSAASNFSSIISIIFLVPILFAGPFTQYLANNLLGQMVKVLPTYYVMEGILDALRDQVTPSGILLNAGVVLGSITVLFLASVWLLRRQATVVGAI